MFLPVHLHCTANDCSLSMLYIIIWEALVLPKLLTVSHSYIQSHYCSPPNLSSAFLAWFFHLHLILYARVPKFLCSLAFLTVSIFEIAVSSLICGHLLFRSSSLHLCVFGHFNNRWDSLSPRDLWSQTGYADWRYPSFTSVRPEKWRRSSSSTPQPLPSEYFLFHVTLPFDVTL
jgi:hypothetical protein